MDNYYICLCSEANTIYKILVQKQVLKSDKLTQRNEYRTKQKRETINKQYIYLYDISKSESEAAKLQSKTHPEATVSGRQIISAGKCIG